MNNIDLNFIELCNVIKNKSLEEVYRKIRNSFEKIHPNIKRSLEDYFSKFPYWGNLKINEGNYEELFLRSKSLKEHIDDFAFLYNNLEDYRSKKTLYAILNNWYNFDFETLKAVSETNYSHYFDLDLIKPNKDEVFVDLGAYTGDTIIDYLNNYGTDNYKKIYCYEITEESFNVLKNNLSNLENIELKKKAVSNKEGILYLKNGIDSSANTAMDEGSQEIIATTIDKDIREKITMIKMDIEGSEEKALIGCKNHIEKDHPKLLISVYHNHEDLWKIPKMIYEMNNDYKFYLRYYGNNIFPTEIVLIAI